MKRKYITGLLLVALSILSLSLPGCQSSKKTAEEKQQVESDETKEDKDTSEHSPGDDANVSQTPLDEIQGEGMPDETIPDLSSIEVAQLNNPVVFASESGADLCSLTVNSIEFTSRRSEEDNTTEQVVVVTYSFDNIASADPILFDSMSFKLLEDKTLSKPYFYPTLINAELTEQGNTGAGQVAFAVSKDCKKVTLVFDNAALSQSVAFESAFEE